MVRQLVPHDSFKRPISSLVPSPPQKVSDLIHTTSAQWKEGLVRSVFTPFDANAILRIPVCTRKLPDCWAWHEEDNGCFTVRSAYRMILRMKTSREGWCNGSEGSPAGQDSNIWSTLWHIQATSKALDAKRRSSPSSPYGRHRLLLLVWSARHLVTCPSHLCAVQERLALASEDLVEKIITHQAENTKDWLFALHEILDAPDFISVVVTAWGIWAARRKAIHEDIFQSPHATDAFIKKYLSELEIVNKREKQQAPQRDPRSSTWVPPAQGCVKTNNVDSAVYGRGKYGAVGAVCRNQHNAFLGASAIVFKHITDPQTLEALAIREALSLADDLYARRIHVASDCWTVVSELNQGMFAAYGAVLREISERLSAFLSCNIGHVKEICPRGNNKVVIYICLYHDKCLFFMLELY